MGPQGAVPPNLGWIAVSGENDPPDYPVNVQIASHQCQCPQFHQSIIVDGINLDIRYLIASSQGQNWTQPQIPAGNEVIIFIHGEGSRAEEALDLIPALFSAGSAAGRHITIVAPDLPGSGYTTRLKDGVRKTPVHKEIADVPAISGPPKVDTSPFTGAPVLDFVEHTISAFVETVVVPFGNPIKAVVGGSLGGHMAMRFAASQKPWVQNVVAWSPASMWEYDLYLLGVDAFPHRVLADPPLSSSATEAESEESRRNFLESIWDENLFPPPPADKFELDVATVAAGVIAVGIVPNVITVAGAAALAAAIIALPTLPPQPEMWYRDDWPPLDGSGNSLPKGSFINAARMDRQEGYNENMRQWHFRICLETIGYKFDQTFAASVQKPLLLMVGEKDDYPMVHFLQYVKAFAGTLTGSGQALTVQDTGHSIQSERPAFLADQILRFTR
jgi:pimeloyl-ACP methyl ester carboxylesterase